MKNLTREFAHVYAFSFSAKRSPNQCFVFNNFCVSGGFQKNNTFKFESCFIILNFFFFNIFLEESRFFFNFAKKVSLFYLFI